MTDKFDNIIFFGLACEDYDVLDFATDFLSGVRANYFNSNCERQSDRCIQYVGQDEYSFVYNMQKDMPLSFKAYINNILLQNSENAPDGAVVRTYKNEILYKKIYFGVDHNWVKTEYFNQNIAETVISKCFIDDKLVLEKITVRDNSTVKTYLYPKTSIPVDGDYSILAFTNKGFIYFNSIPNDEFISKIVIQDDSVDSLGGFNFSEVDFNLNRNMNSTFDITDAEYLTEDNAKPFVALSSAEFVNETSEFAEDNTDTNIIVENGLEEKPDDIVESCGEKYSYYGEILNGKRNGHGRTVTSYGTTAYEGEYLDDKRNGFGTFYYKNGDINYTGNWENNTRSGFGVGFRSSDKTSHIGKWNSNVPDGIGARFDKDGNFLFLGNYVDGKKQGIGITVDDNGNFVVSKFKDDEVISSRLLEE